MNGPADLHIYQCSFCRTTASSTVRRREANTLIRCVYCQRFMAYKYSTPILTDSDRAMAERGVVFNNTIPEEVQPYTKRPCDTCRTHVEEKDLIRLSGVGRFCSEDCAQVGVLQHQEFMKRLDRTYEEFPELRKKETA